MVVPEKGPLNGCVCVCVFYLDIVHCISQHHTEVYHSKCHTNSLHLVTITIICRIQVSNIPNWASAALVETMPVDESIEKYSRTLLSSLLSGTMEYSTSTIRLSSNSDAATCQTDESNHTSTQHESMHAYKSAATNCVIIPFTNKLCR